MLNGMAIEAAAISEKLQSFTASTDSGKARTILLQFQQKDANPELLKRLLEACSAVGVNRVEVDVTRESSPHGYRVRTQRPRRTNSSDVRFTMKVDGQVFYKDQWIPGDDIASLLMEFFSPTPDSIMTIELPPVDENFYPLYSDIERMFRAGLVAGFKKVNLIWSNKESVSNPNKVYELVLHESKQ
jgi:hypothetical protein